MEMVIYIVSLNLSTSLAAMQMSFLNMLPCPHLNLRNLIPYNMLEIRMLSIEEKVAEVTAKGDHHKAKSYMLNLKLKGITTHYKPVLQLLVYDLIIRMPLVRLRGISLPC